MFKKTLLALTAAAALIGFTGLTTSTPAEAQGYRQGPAHQWRGGPAHPPRWQHRPHYRWNGGYGRGYRPWVGTGIYITPPGLYAYDCRIVRKRIRYLTDYGWRSRWRTTRVCG